jgi:hypothetical protein
VASFAADEIGFVSVAGLAKIIRGKAIPERNLTVSDSVAVLAIARREGLVGVSGDRRFLRCDMGIVTIATTELRRPNDFVFG